MERAVPLMRPMTPASIGPSLHQIKHQLMEAEVELENYSSRLSASFEMMRQQLLPPLTSPSLVQHHTRIQPLQGRLCQTTLPQEEEMDCSNDDSGEKGNSSECSGERHQPVTKHQSQSAISLAAVQVKQPDLSSTSINERSSGEGVETVRQQSVVPAIPPSSIWHNQPPLLEDLGEGGPHPHQTSTPSSSLSQDEKELILTKSSGCGSGGGGGCCEVVHGSKSSGGGEGFSPPSSNLRPSTRGSR